MSLPGRLHRGHTGWIRSCGRLGKLQCCRQRSIPACRFRQGQLAPGRDLSHFVHHGKSYRRQVIPVIKAVYSCEVTCLSQNVVYEKPYPWALHPYGICVPCANGFFKGGVGAQACTACPDRFDTSRFNGTLSLPHVSMSGYGLHSSSHVYIFESSTTSAFPLNCWLIEFEIHGHSQFDVLGDLACCEVLPGAFGNLQKDDCHCIVQLDPPYTSHFRNGTADFKCELCPDGKLTYPS